jgi:hypothetical protein
VRTEDEAYFLILYFLFLMLDNRNFSSSLSIYLFYFPNQRWYVLSNSSEIYTSPECNTLNLYILRAATRTEFTKLH